MNVHDPTACADLTQGRIKHIDFHIKADFSSCLLNIEATYQMQEPLRGSLYLDAFKIEMQEAHAVYHARAAGDARERLVARTGSAAFRASP